MATGVNMKIALVLLIFLFISLACTSKPDDFAEQTNVDIQESSAVNTSMDREPFFELVPASDSTSYIRWGKGALIRTTEKTYHNWPIQERLSLFAQNDHYMILGFWTGSDTHLKLILPFDQKTKVQRYWNDITFDIDNEIIVFEYSAQDTVLIAENFRNHKRQAIGMDWPRCESAFAHYCIKKPRIENKTLHLQWTADFFFDGKVGQEMKVKLEI